MMPARRRWRRWQIAAVALVVIAVSFGWLLRGLWSAPTFAAADYQGPTRFYRLSWHGQAVGRQQESLRQLPTGEWLLELELTVAATVRDAPLQYREHEQLLFAAAAPHRLLRGDWRRDQNGATARLQFDNAIEQLQGVRWLGEQRSVLQQAAIDYSR